MYHFTTEDVNSAIQMGDKGRMQEISQYFFSISGIYKRLVYLFATMPKFYTLVVPHLLAEKVPEKKIMKDFSDALEFIDDLNVSLTFPSINLSVFKNGVYYGYLRADKQKPVIQTLPLGYCRSRFKKDNRYTVEFNLNYFDREFRDTAKKNEALKQFPKEFQKHYNSYKGGKTSGTEKEWVLLDPDYSICFKLPDEAPFFLPIIIDLIELRGAKDVELSRDKLELFQLLIQRMPFDKEGNPIFDIFEARELHNNVLKMLQHNQGIDVLTTFAETEMLNIKEARQTQKDNLLKSERSVFNEAGVSKMLFAAEANISLGYSIINNESIFNFLWPLYSDWLSHAVNLITKKNARYYFEVWMPPVTIFNEKDMEERYRKQATFGYAKLLPGIMTGIKQGTLLNLMKFENDYLKLNDMMEPLKSSHTQSGGESGRPSKPDEEKTDDTIDNENEGSQGGE
jgi:hypothetical protein